MAEASDQSLSPEQLEGEAYDWVVRFASRDAGQQDIEELKRWAARSAAHAQAFEHASRAWGVVGAAARPVFIGAEAAVTQDNRPATHAPVRLGRRAFLGGALAASAAAAAVVVVRPPLDLWPSWSELSADYRTEVGETRQIRPFDNVAIEMNTRTSMTRLEAHDGVDRIEILSGEAIVSTPGLKTSALTVVAGDSDIVVRDARFNVRRDPTSVCVTCLEGEVQVARHSQRQTVSAGQQWVYADGGIAATSSVDMSSVTAWQSGLLIFQATPVSDVIAEVNRYRRGKIILTNAALGRERFSARFRIEGVERIVDQIHEIFGARVTTLPGGIVLLG